MAQQHPEPFLEPAAASAPPPGARACVKIRLPRAARPIITPSQPQRSSTLRRPRLCDIAVAKNRMLTALFTSPIPSNQPYRRSPGKRCGRGLLRPQALLPLPSGYLHRVTDLHPSPGAATVTGSHRPRYRFKFHCTARSFSSAPPHHCVIRGAGIRNSDRSDLRYLSALAAAAVKGVSSKKLQAHRPLCSLKWVKNIFAAVQQGPA